MRALTLSSQNLGNAQTLSWVAPSNLDLVAVIATTGVAISTDQNLTFSNVYGPSVSKITESWIVAVSPNYQSSIENIRVPILEGERVFVAFDGDGSATIFFEENFGT